MTFLQWIQVEHFENMEGNKPWGLLHISVLLFCIAACVCTYFLRKHPIKLRVNIIRGVAAVLLLLEIANRIVKIMYEKRCFELGITETEAEYINNIIFRIIPRPWCAISVWLIIIAAIVNKRLFYNIAAMNAIVCVVIYFAYPDAGFGDKYILFGSFYSISTHMLLFIGGISMITMGLTDFKYVRTNWKDSAIWELVAILGVFGYAVLQIVTGLGDSDPLFFMPGNGVQEILGVTNTLYVVMYTLFLIFYFNLFFLIQMLVDKKRAKKAVLTNLNTVEEAV